MTSEELQQYKAKENTRRSKLRIKQREKMSPEDLSNYRKNDAMRKAEKKEICEPEIVNIPYSTPYCRKQNCGKAMKQSMESLPSSPRKKIAIVTGLAERVGVQFQENVEKYLGPIGVSDELRRMSEDFYLRSDISYTSPGMLDVMTVWNDDGKKKLRKHYLTMYLREAHHIFQQTHCDISFSVFCKLRPVNVLLLGNSPKDQCKCMTHENFLKLEALDIEYTSNYWNGILCDATLNSDCWLSKCEECKDGKKIVVVEEKYVNYKKWMEVMIPRKQNKGENENEVDKKEKEYYKVLRIHSDKMDSSLRI